MSAGAFVRTNYELQGGQITGISVQPETLSLTIAGTANAAVAGAKTPGLPSAIVGGSRKKIGIHTRLVRITFTGAVPSGYLSGSTIALPVLSNTAAAVFVKDATGTYTLGGTGYDVRIVGVTGEVVV